MSPSPRPLPPELGGQFSVRRASDAGATRRRMRARDLTRPFRGVRRSVRFIEERGAAAERDNKPYAEFRRKRQELIDDAHAYAMVMPPGAFFCGATAAVIGDSLPVKFPDALDVAVVAPQRAPRAKGVRGRKVAEHLVTIGQFEGLRLTSPASTWAMLGRDHDLRDLVAIGDALVQIPRDNFGLQHPEFARATIADLATELARGPRPPSTKKLHEALGLIRVGSSSVLETEFRLDAAAAGLPDPELDMEIHYDGTRLGISEFVYPRYRVVVEVEGDHHRTSRGQWNRDIEKYQAYVEAGWETIRLTSSHIRGREADAVQRVAAALKRHGWVG
ncbi:hypothetical protein ACSS7Z_03590 [Microbacterium sp. A82]|uniref:hypothetical protein n=1 Tax=Microbacterium sp. A82 TaxID=3450452 RepID=UPI003F33EAFC